jgi:hypothetical protein
MSPEPSSLVPKFETVAINLSLSVLLEGASLASAVSALSSVGGGTVVIVAIGICTLFLRLGLAALKGSARVEIRSKWSLGKIANGEIELIRHGTNSEAHGDLEPHAAVKSP